MASPTNSIRHIVGISDNSMSRNDNRPRKESRKESKDPGTTSHPELVVATVLVLFDVLSVGVTVVYGAVLTAQHTTEYDCVRISRVNFPNLPAVFSHARMNDPRILDGSHKTKAIQLRYWNPEPDLDLSSASSLRSWPRNTPPPPLKGGHSDKPGSWFGKTMVIR